MGRPSKYTKAIADEIREYIRDGLTQEDAACLAGISKSTFYNWAKEKPEFLDSLKKAWIENKLRHIKSVDRKDKSWQASAWWLERRFQNEFALQLNRGEEDGTNLDGSEIVDE